MDSNHIINKAIEEVNDLKDKGIKELDIDFTLNYLQKIKTQVSIGHDFSLEEFKAQNQLHIETMKVNEAINLESFRSTISIGMNAAKSCLLINGGASIALLAFIGNIWRKESMDIAALLVSKGLLIFCFGVALSVLCSGFTYLAQSNYTSSDLGRNEKLRKIGGIFNIAAIAAGFLSLIAFGYGAYQTYLSMHTQFSGT